MRWHKYRTDSPKSRSGSKSVGVKVMNFGRHREHGPVLEVQDEHVGLLSYSSQQLLFR